MKVASIVAALLSSFFISGLTAFEATFNPKGPFHTISVWDQRLAAICIGCCVLAFWKPTSAAVIAWGSIAIRVIVGLGIASQFGLDEIRFSGMAKYALALAIFLTLTVWLANRRALSLGA